MDTTSSMLQMVLSLAAVVAMILGLAWMTRRMQNLRGTQSADLRVKASLTVGMKERVVIIEAMGQQFLIGVAPGQVSILKFLGSAETLARFGATRAGSESEQAPGCADAKPGCAEVRSPSLRESFEHQLKQLLGR